MHILFGRVACFRNSTLVWVGRSLYLLYPGEQGQGYFSFARFFLSSPLSPWKPCGSYATFGSKETLVCSIDGCGMRVRSRNVTWMQYLKAAPGVNTLCDILTHEIQSFACLSLSTSFSILFSLFFHSL